MNFQLKEIALEQLEVSDFRRIPKLLYSSDSLRLVHGHDVKREHLVSCFVLYQNNQPVGRFAFYVNLEMRYNDRTVACIGSYECIESIEASKFLLNKAKQLATKYDLNYLIGPMEGSTWQSYRFSDNNEVPFFMEPVHKMYYPHQFIQNGFDIIANYVSHLDKELFLDEQLMQKEEIKFREKEIKFRRIDIDRYKEELQLIAKCAIEGFAANLLYTPISAEQFVKQYLPLKPLINPNLIWLAIQNEQVVGFVFGYEDRYAKEKSFVLKSWARLPEAKYRGLGLQLTRHLMKRAKELGFTQSIHAMMFAGNQASQFSEEFYGKSYKRYYLYGYKIVN